MAEELPEISQDLVLFAARKLADVDREGWKKMSEDARRDYRAGARRVLRAERTHLERHARKSEQTA
jgi:hypothetical protein